MTLGQRVIAFIERYLHAPEGDAVGKPIRLLPFQRKFILAIFDSPRRIRRAILSIARKNGKTALIACLILAYLIGPVAKQNAVLVSAANSRDQANMVMRYTKKIIELSPKIQKLCKVMKYEIRGLRKNTTYYTISAEAKTSFGESPYVCTIDEMGAIEAETDEFVDALETSLGAYENALLVAISTQARDDKAIFSQWIDSAPFQDDTICHVYAAEKDCRMDDEAQWAAANPALGKFLVRDIVAAECAKAMRMPASEAAFRRFRMNQRVEAKSPFISRDIWEAARLDERPKGKKLLRVSAGLDLSINIDLTAYVVCFEYTDGTIWIEPHFWIPRSDLLDREHADRVPYTLWAKQSWLNLVEGGVVDPDFVARQVGEINERDGVQIVAYDTFNIKTFMLALDRANIKYHMINAIPDKKTKLPRGRCLWFAFRQGTVTMGPAVNEFEMKLYAHQLKHGGNPVMNHCLSCAVVKEDDSRNRKLVKNKSSGHIDGAIAALMAVKVREYVEGIRKPSVFADPNFKLAALAAKED